MRTGQRGLPQLGLCEQFRAGLVEEETVGRCVMDGGGDPVLASERGLPGPVACSPGGWGEGKMPTIAVKCDAIFYF